MSVQLAIESSQRCGGVALRDARGKVRTASLESASGVDDRLMPAISELFDEAGAKPRDLSLIGVSIGPGGFTGLRVAVSTARSLAMTTGCHVVAVPTAAVVAAHGPDTNEDVLVLLSGKRGSAWLSRVGPNGQIVGEPGLVTGDTLAAELLDCGAVFGDAYVPEALQEVIRKAGHRLMDPVWSPTACLEWAEQAALAGQADDPQTLEPLYPRPPEAVRVYRDR